MEKLSKTKSPGTGKPENGDQDKKVMKQNGRICVDGRREVFTLPNIAENRVHEGLNARVRAQR